MNIYIVIDCGDPGIPNNGVTTGTSTTFGSVVTHACDVGFKLVGENSLTCICLESGNWSAPLPVCEGKFCTVSDMHCIYRSVPMNRDIT